MLVIVGDGSLRENLEIQADKMGIADDVYFLGERKDIPGLLGMVDAFVFPSHSEAFPTAVLEAQAAGVECFVSENVSNSIDLTNYIHWINLEETDEELADTILNTQTVDKEFEGLEDYSIKHTVEQLEKLYTA